MIILNIVCKKCGEILKETDRCCLKCGTLNSCNEKTIEEEKRLEILSKYYEDSGKDKLKNVRKLKFSFIIDALYVFLLAKLFSLITTSNFLICFIISLIICFYRLVVLKMLLYKCNLWWQGVYIPIYGFLLTFELGFIKKVSIYAHSLWILILGPFSLGIFLYEGFILGDLILLLLIFIYFFRIHIKICNSLCYRFGKDKRFKILLILFCPVLILNLAFENETGKSNLEEEEFIRI